MRADHAFGLLLCLFAVLALKAVPAFAAWFGITPKVTAELRTVLEEKLIG